MKVIYIAGAGHSGSTLLDLMLNAHPQIISVGELVNLNRKLQFKNLRKKRYPPCSCGAPSLWQCEFWSGVNHWLLQTEGKSIAELDLHPRGHRNGANEIIYRGISEVSGKKFVVDSSKVPARLAELLKADSLEIYPIHLIRNPKGQIYSAIKKQSGLLRSLLQYEIVHDQVRRQLRSRPHCVVHYEDLVVEPEITLSKLLKPLGLQFNPRQLFWAEQVKHLVAGNRVRRQQQSRLALDNRWETGLNTLQKLVIDGGTFRSRRLLGKTGFALGG